MQRHAFHYSGIHDAHSTPSALDNNEGEIPFIMVVLANRPSKRSVRTLLTDQKTEEGGRVFKKNLDTDS